MKRHLWKYAIVVILATCTITLFGQQAGPPQGPPFEPKNLKVFPKDVTRQRLLGAMQSFNRALGVKCDHCHAEDKASDEKPEKEVARAMIRMLTNLHENGKDFLPGERVNKVNCWTCHRGNAKIDMPPPPGPPQPGGQRPPQ